mgnify:CR=1 FL=1
MGERCSIIANPEGNAWEFAFEVHKYLIKKETERHSKKRKEFSEKIEEYLKETNIDEETTNRFKGVSTRIYELIKEGDGSEFELNPVEIRNFPDGEFKPQIKKNIRGSNCFFIHDSSLDPSRWFTELCLINNALRNSSANQIVNVLPYSKFNRQDKKDQSRVPISSQVVANVLNNDRTRVLTLEVHNESTQGSYNVPFDSLPAFPFLIRYFKENHPEILENLVVLGPDSGSIKRIERYIEKFGLEKAIVDKYRKVTGILGESLGILGNVKEKNVLVYDDIGSTGNTQINASKAAKNAGAINIVGYCTHGIFSEGVEKILEHFDGFYVGNTIKQPNVPKLNVVSFVNPLAEAIYRIHRGYSLSELFE